MSFYLPYFNLVLVAGTTLVGPYRLILQNADEINKDNKDFVDIWGALQSLQVIFQPAYVLKSGAPRRERKLERLTDYRKQHKLFVEQAICCILTI